MIIIKKILPFFLLLSLCLFILGCQDSSEHVLEQSPTPSPNPKTETPWKKQKPQPSLQAKEPQSSRPRIVYLADLVQKNQVVLSKPYKDYLKTRPQHLRKNIVYHDKKHSIFQHPIPALANAIIFPRIDIHKQTALHFSIGIFSNNNDNFVSDGVTFSIRIKGQENAEEMVFQETLQDCDVWKDYRVNLSAYAGQQVELQLLTDPYQNIAYDWAV